MYLFTVHISELMMVLDRSTQSQKAPEKKKKA
jgi:hypothetical protein